VRPQESIRLGESAATPQTPHPHIRLSRRPAARGPADSVQLDRTLQSRGEVRER